MLACVSRRHEIGDGDVCPLNPEHGQMMFLSCSPSQWCPDASHEGVWTFDGKERATRSIWPKGIDSFRRAVIQATLPEIDIKLIGG